VLIEQKGRQEIMADIVSPLPGLVATIHVNAGDTISEGDPVVTLQSMKMEIPVTAEAGGEVAEVLVAEGDEIDTGAVIARLA
jgi:biotin carboxyl carrier protein